MTRLTENASFQWCGKKFCIVLLERLLKDQQELAELLERFVDTVTECSKDPECDLCNPVKNESGYIQYLKIAVNCTGERQKHMCTPGMATSEWYQNEASKCFDMLANDPSQNFLIYTRFCADCDLCGKEYCHRCRYGNIWHNDDCKGFCE